MAEEDGSPASRADARRNRERVLTAARASFAAEGRMVPLAVIARQAGVGAGTVYRHFPSKEDLFEAVISDSVAGFVTEGRSLSTADDPTAALFGFLERVIRDASLNRALCEALGRQSAGAVPPDPTAAGRREFEEVLEVLLRRAQEAGAVRRDVEAAHVQALLAGCAAAEQVAEQPPRGGSGGGRPGINPMVAVVCDGLRSERAVTKIRYEKRGKAADPHNGAARCEMCDEPLTPARSGRPARFCGAACRQKAYRRRTS
ncbi:TetR/AcrR family transcriptional regulator [Streptomyces ochraceiscleroticus]|uniref:TetR/AcrR family transcriptional regulator n=1 Tax=Streptomyces ochraceiscleroticus TaxID=47761 RepID=A0ABW1MRF0_9ACTN|nr:TetR/AcrR family transcriptional regulator [Streptomyces ochraceiscleroticus]